MSDEKSLDEGFLCPICGSRKYTVVSSGSIIGTSFECEGCSIHFGNPDEFSITGKIRKGSPLSQPEVDLLLKICGADPKKCLEAFLAGFQSMSEGLFQVLEMIGKVPEPKDPPQR